MRRSCTTLVVDNIAVVARAAVVPPGAFTTVVTVLAPPTVVSSIAVPTIAGMRAAVASFLAQLLGINLWERRENAGRRGRVSAPRRIIEVVHGDHTPLHQILRGTSPLRRETDRQQRPRR